VKKIIGISPIVVILALVVGGKLAGFLGVLLAIPLSTALMEFVNDVQKDRMHDGEALYKTNA
jgi:predicted PurR-regulated permease PerM